MQLTRMQITRRTAARILAAGAAAPAIAAPQTEGGDKASLVRERFERNAREMGAVKIPMAVEPPFHFKA
jgi:hypothetical protein